MDEPEVSYLPQYLEALLQTCTLKIKDDKLATSSDELVFVGADLGCGFTNTKDLKVMKFKEPIVTPDKDN